MSRHLTNDWVYQPRSKIRFVHDFIDANEATEENDDDREENFKLHEIQLKVKKHISNES